MPSRRLGLIRSIPLAVAGLLVVLGEAVAQTAPCGLDNPLNWCAHQDLGTVSDAAEADERFGAALVFGDFNGDGFDDLAVGVPNEEGVGAVHVFPGSASGLTLAGQLFFSQNNVAGADEGAEAGDEFGFALAAGDFNGDGFDDLAVGSPGEDLPNSEDVCTFGTCNDFGVVHVLRGSAGGLALASATTIGTEAFASAVIQDDAAAGTALTAFDANGDGFHELFVGAPGARNSGAEFRGIVIRLNGAATGLEVDPNTLDNLPIEENERYGSVLAGGRLDSGASGRVVVGSPLRDLGGTDVGEVLLHAAGSLPISFRQIDFSTAGEASNDRFGAALITGDFDGNGLDDLVAGAPGKDHGDGNPNDSGRVYVAFSSSTGPNPTFFDLIGEDEWDGQTPAAGENFGAALAAGDVTGDGIDDLLVGAPGEGAQGGFLFLKPGSVGGLTTTGNRVISQGFLGGLTEAGDRFGSVLTVGDVNGDGILELAVGVPAKDIGAHADAGLVYVTRFFDAISIFSDGFESGTTAAWSLAVP